MITRLLTFLVLATALCAGACRKRTIVEIPLAGEDAQNPANPLHSLEDARSDKKGLRVLWIGNSFTFSNNLPELVTKLANAAGEELPLIGVTETPGGQTLQQHWDNGSFAKLLDEIKFDVVILQEQSQRPSFAAAQVAQEMYPAARKMHAKAKERGARTMFFLTWAYRNGDQMNIPGDSYANMQGRLKQGYVNIARELKADVAPAGLAWEQALKQRPNLELWSGDGSHPAMPGSYLAACVFYDMLYRKSAVGNSFTAGLPADEAKFLQETAAATVAKWRAEQAKK